MQCSSKDGADWIFPTNRGHASATHRQVALVSNYSVYFFSCQMAFVYIFVDATSSGEQLLLFNEFATTQMALRVANKQTEIKNISYKKSCRYSPIAENFSTVFVMFILSTFSCNFIQNSYLHRLEFYKFQVNMYYLPTYLQYLPIKR